MKKTNKWIQSAKPKKGALSRQLKIPVSENIPIGILVSIMHTEIGKYVYTPRKGYIKVTKLLKKRANFALNVKRIK